MAIKTTLSFAEPGKVHILWKQSLFSSTVFCQMTCKIKIECYNWCQHSRRGIFERRPVPASQLKYLASRICTCLVPHECPRASELGFRSPNFTVNTSTGPLRLGVRGKQATFQQSLDVTCDQECDPSKWLCFCFWPFTLASQWWELLRRLSLAGSAPCHR